MSGGEAGSPIVLAVDGGGSKTDLLLLDLHGEVVAWERGSGCNPQTMGWGTVRAELDRLRSLALAAAQGRTLVAQHVYLAGLDLPAELDAARDELAHWAVGRTTVVLDNDLFALLRAGTDAADAVAVVCGTGINAIGVRADGATARFPSLGEISGDWGGGAGLGAAALWHAARAEDGRGPDTALRDAVPARFGLDSVRAVFEGLHFGRIPQDAVPTLTPLLFAAAEQGDAVAASVVDRQAEEVVVMAASIVRRLGLEAVAVPVVLGGSVLAAREPRLVAHVEAGIAAHVPLATAAWFTAPPVQGAALLALDAAGAGPSALARATRTIGPLAVA